MNDWQLLLNSGTECLIYVLQETKNLDQPANFNTELLHPFLTIVWLRKIVQTSIKLADYRNSMNDGNLNNRLL